MTTVPYAIASNLQRCINHYLSFQNGRRGCRLREEERLELLLLERQIKWTLSRGFVCLDRLSRMTEKKDPEIVLNVRLRKNTNAKPSLSFIHYKLSRGYGYETGETSWKYGSRILRNGLLYRWFISNSRNEEHLALIVPRRCVEILLYNTHIHYYILYLHRERQKCQILHFCLTPCRQVNQHQSNEM